MGMCNMIKWWKDFIQLYLFLYLERRLLVFMITVEELASDVYCQRDYDSATSLVIFHGC